MIPDRSYTGTDPPGRAPVHPGGVGSVGSPVLCAVVAGVGLRMTLRNALVLAV